MKKRILLMAAAAVLMTASAAAFAHGYYYGGPRVVIGVPWGRPRRADRRGRRIAGRQRDGQ